MSVCVCLSVKSHLTSGAFVRPEDTVTYSVGNEGQKYVMISLGSNTAQSGEPQKELIPLRLWLLSRESLC